MLMLNFRVQILDSPRILLRLTACLFVQLFVLVFISGSACTRCVFFVHFILCFDTISTQFLYFALSRCEKCLLNAFARTEANIQFMHKENTNICVKTNKCSNYSFTLLSIYGNSYMFRHYIAILFIKYIW
jgi:hypothetical protein